MASSITLLQVNHLATLWVPLLSLTSRFCLDRHFGGMSISKFNAPSEKAQLTTIFRDHDIDKDGEISKEELKKAFQKLGAWFPEWRVRGALQYADANGDGRISMDEINNLVKYAFRLEYTTNHLTPASKSNIKFIPSEEGQLKTIFNDHDVDKDGEISKEELKKAFQKLGAWYPEWRVNRALQHADANGDGRISMGEINNLVKYAFSLEYTTKHLTPASK
ncbi:calcium-binding protein CML16 [Tripterygium wilfordii]|uniref:Calcium-binding protein CML16 n=1 Tax=Tripterygium wilfordii TaxID=458696 RepID=A0A7J7DL42_TRIWF|nr:calcium-binding protein CML16 [Tripterygium wilfordii]